MYYESDDFKAGDSGIYDYIRNAGCDSLGFLTGSIGLTENLKDKILGYESTCSGSNNFEYTKNTDFLSLLKLESKDKEERKIYQSAKEVAGKSVRFNIYDIEKFTILIPEYDQIRVGDILVNNGYSTSSIAVVTEIDNENIDRNGITVVCIEEKSEGTAVQKKWSELENPKEYCARRLLKQKQNADSAFVWGKRNFKLGKKSDPNTTSDYVLDIDGEKIISYNHKIAKGGYITIMGMHEMDYPEGDWRWIPNTGEYLHLYWPHVYLFGYSGVELMFLEYSVEVIAKDRNYDSSKNYETYGNIYNNTSSAKFTIALKTHNQINDYCTLKVVDYEDGSREYIQEEDKRRLTLKKYAHRLQDMNGVEIRDLYIRPENAKDFKPGNDLILGLRLKSENVIIKESERSELHKYTVDIFTDQKDYVACYDKKALWRANLYIEEQKDDWNNLHPWDAPVDADDKKNHSISLATAKVFGYNEWNRKYDFDRVKDGYGIEKFNVGNGTQNNISINNSTYSYNNSNGVVTRKAVGYDWEGQDGPFIFNYKTDCQKKVIGQFFDIGESFKGIIDENCICSISDEEFEKYTFTAAPKDGDLVTKHAFYIHSKQIYNTQKLGTVFINENAYKYDGESLIVEGNSYYPYISSLTNSVTKQFESEKGSPSNSLTGYTAGTDCVSFGQRSCGYLGNNYKWAEIDESLWGGSWSTNQHYPYLGEISYKIASYDLLDDNLNLLYLNYVVPGDILYYVSSGDGTKNGSHLMVVSDNTGNGVSTASSIKIIESTNGSSFGNVCKNRSVDNLESNNKKWFIVRLMCN